MRDPQVERKEVSVRYDQEDLGIAYARLGGRWTECHSSHYNVLKGRSEKQLALAVQRLRQKRSVIERGRAITACQIARFFELIEGEEVLRSQRMKDLARHRIEEASAQALAVPAVPPTASGHESEPEVPGQQGGRESIHAAPVDDSVFADF